MQIWPERLEPLVVRSLEVAAPIVTEQVQMEVLEAAVLLQIYQVVPELVRHARL